MHNWARGINEVNCSKSIVKTVGYSYFITRNNKSCQLCYCTVRNGTTSETDEQFLYALCLLPVSHILQMKYIIYINKQRFAIMSTSSKKDDQAARSVNRCPVFGLPQNCTKMNLPTYRDVMKDYTYLRLKHSNKM